MFSSISATWQELHLFYFSLWKILMERFSYWNSQIKKRPLSPSKDKGRVNSWYHLYSQMSHNICLIKSHDYISCETLSTITCANPAHPTFDNIMFRLLLRNVFRISSSASRTNRRFSVSDLYLYSFPSKHLSIPIIIQATLFICQ